jgi:hypothetical protein
MPRPLVARACAPPGAAAVLGRSRRRPVAFALQTGRKVGPMNASPQTFPKRFQIAVLSHGDSRRTGAICRHFERRGDATRTRDLRRDKAAFTLERGIGAPGDLTTGRSAVFEVLRALQAASVLQASGFRGNVSVFRLSAVPGPKTGSEPAFRGMRRNACTYSRRLITRRSQVQILPPLPRRRPRRRGLSLWSGCSHFPARPCEAMWRQWWGAQPSFAAFATPSIKRSETPRASFSQSWARPGSASPASCRSSSRGSTGRECCGGGASHTATASPIGPSSRS